MIVLRFSNGRVEYQVSAMAPPEPEKVVRRGEDEWVVEDVQADLDGTISVSLRPRLTS